MGPRVVPEAAVSGGSAAGGSAAGGCVAGGSTAGGSVTDGSVAGGSTADGFVVGGSVVWARPWGIVGLKDRASIEQHIASPLSHQVGQSLFLSNPPE